MIEILSISFFSGMMGIFIIILLLISALLLIGKNPFKSFSLTALVTTKPLAANLPAFGRNTSWSYGLLTGSKKGGTIGRAWREPQTGKKVKEKGVQPGKAIGLVPKTGEAFRVFANLFNKNAARNFADFYIARVLKKPDQNTARIDYGEVPRITKKLASDKNKSLGKILPAYFDLIINIKNLKGSKEKLIEERNKITKKQKLDQKDQDKLKKIDEKLKQLNEFETQLKNATRLFAQNAKKTTGITTDHLATVANFSKYGINTIDELLKVVAKEKRDQIKNEDEAKKEFIKTVKDMVNDYNKNPNYKDFRKVAGQLKIDEKKLNKIFESAKQLKDIYTPPANQDTLIKEEAFAKLIELNKKLEDYSKDMAAAYAIHTYEKGENKDSAFAKIVNLSEVSGVDLATPFLAGLNIASNNPKESKKAVFDYNTKTVTPPRQGLFPAIKTQIEKEVGTGVKLDIPYARVDMKEVNEEVKRLKSNQAKLQNLNPYYIENAIHVISHNNIINSKSTGEKISFPYLIMAGGVPPYYKKPPTNKG